MSLHMFPSVYTLLWTSNAPGTHPDSGRQASAGVQSCSMVFGPKHQLWGKHEDMLSYS